MWRPLSASRWILLLTLGVVMLFSESGANFHDDYLPCCFPEQFEAFKRPTREIQCIEITPRHKCRYHAYLIKYTAKGPERCIEAAHLQNWMKKSRRRIKCENLTSGHIFEVLDEDEDDEQEEEEEEEE